jgi:hypothetical protein
LIAQPNSVACKRPDFDWSHHANPLPHPGGRVHLFATAQAEWRVPSRRL